MQSPSISALYKLAKLDFSQKILVRWNPVLGQKIIQHTQVSSIAFLHSYAPCVTHSKVLFFIPSATHNISYGDPLPASIPSHIHCPPQL